MLTVGLLLAATPDDKAFQVGQAVGTVVGVIVAVLFLLAFPALCLLSFVQYARTKKQGWLIGGIISAVGCLIPIGLVVVGFGVGLKKSFQTRHKYTQGTALLPADRKVKTPDGSLHLQLPAHWRNLTNLNELAILQVGNPSREEYLIVLSEAKSDYAGTLADYAQIASEAMKGRVQDGQLTQLEQVAINNHPGFQCELTGKVGVVNIVYLLSFVEGQDGYYQLIAWTLPSKKAVALPVFRETLQTCELR